MTTMRLASFADALDELAATRDGFTSFPVLRPTNAPPKVLRTVADIDAAFGGDLHPSDWEFFAQLSTAAHRQIEFKRLDRPDASASEAREAQHLRGVRREAMERAKALHAEMVQERTLELRGEGHTVGPQLRDGEYRGGVGAPGLGASGSWRVGTSERTYRPDDRSAGRPTFLTDLFAAQIKGDPSAGERLARHGHEVETDLPGFANRAVTTGAVAGFTPPAYLVEQFAELARAGRPVANLCTPLPLPDRGMVVNVPRITTGTTASVQASEGAAIGNTDLDDTVLACPVVTVAGYTDVSRQAIERGEMVEALILGDLAADYASKLDAQVIFGTGTSGQHTGLLTVAGTTTITYTDATPTVGELWPKIADAVRKVVSQRYTGPTALILHPLTWGWLMAQVDSSGRPLVDFTGKGSNPTAVVSAPTYDGSAGTLFGVPVFLSGNVPTNLGAGTNETAIIAADMRDTILFEDASQAPAQLRFDGPLSSTLGVRLLAYGYSALAAGRQPTAISKVVGTGLILPAL